MKNLRYRKIREILQEHPETGPVIAKLFGDSYLQDEARLNETLSYAALSNDVELKAVLQELKEEARNGTLVV
jgi:hypothetical protein